MAFIMIFFLYKKVRIDLFRDKVFKIRADIHIYNTGYFGLSVSAEVFCKRHGAGFCERLESAN
jgi:hypothetical protein